MRNVILDIQAFEEKAALHQYLKEQLQFPFYYGANLDALFDELTSATEAMAVTLRYPRQGRGQMADYLPRLLLVFQEAARENYNLSVSFEEQA